MFRRLYSLDGWSLGRWECSHHAVEEPVEEVATCREIVIPVSGAFVRQRSGREILASPLTAVLADAGDTYTVRHPVAGGDECLVLLLGETALEDLGRATAAVRGISAPRFRQYDVAVSSAAFVSAVRLLSAAGSGDMLQVESAAARLLDLLLTSSEAAASQAGRSPRAEARHRTAAARGTARRSGLSVLLIESAAQLAADEGASIVEGYPVEPRKNPMPAAFAFTGLASAFRAAGFVEVERRSATRPIMRRFPAKIR